ncbi:MAG: hypothetical protein MK078_02860 [Crocinitomicaceae bacterium]|nr:hypothetical protein [Crocinitomicaceae bacterium]
MDFAAVSFYPFFIGQHSHRDFQKEFDFLHSNVTVPIGFSETTHLANDLEIASFELYIKSSEKEQNDYLESLLINVDKNSYEFVIWWSHRDFDKLWETFPDDVKDVGKLWKDTGLLDENGNSRPAFETWKETFSK